MDKYEVLREYFGYETFRFGQEKVIDAILEKRDTLAVMPTGAGKSLCFQIPALMLDGVTLVVSPLISLMKDQVRSLLQNGVAAAYINGSLTEKQIALALSRFSKGEYKIVYVAPERLFMPSFKKACSSVKISLLCVDEAHCVSQWGQDFRPSYLQIKSFVSSLESRPVLCAMTATATQRVREDILNLIGLENPDVTVLSFDRPNLHFAVVKSKSKPQALRYYLDLYNSRSGIVYCSSRKNVDKLHCALLNEGYDVTKYHAGMDSFERKKNQELFISDDVKIIIATNAFGMGIDKSNVSFVIHYNMPADIESYYQEAGRAGRDGNNADCILLFGKQDIRTQLYFIDNAEDNPSLSAKQKSEIRRNRIEKLDAMIEYTDSKKCLREYILSYFGQESESRCNNCSFCCEETQSEDITLEAQKILSCVLRVKETQNAAVICDILKGNKTDVIEENSFDTLSTYAISKGSSIERISSVINFLLSHGYLKTKNGALKVCEKSKDVLFKGRKLYLTDKKKPQKKAKGEENLSFSQPLFERLKALRFDLSKKHKVPAYIIFTDSSLKDMAMKKPTNENEFMQVSGVGRKKLENYGAVFIKEILEYLLES